MTSLADLTESQNETNEHLQHIEDKFDDFFRDTFNRRGEMLESKRENNSAKRGIGFGLPNVGKMLGKAADNTMLKSLLGLASLLTGLGALKSFLDNFDQYKTKFDTFMDGLLEGLDKYQVNMNTLALALAQTALGVSAGGTKVLSRRAPSPPPNETSKTAGGTSTPNGKYSPGKSVAYKNAKGEVKVANVVQDLGNGKLQVQSKGATYAIDIAKNQAKLLDLIWPDSKTTGSPSGVSGGVSGSTGSKILSGASKAFAVGGVALTGYEIGQIRTNEGLSEREKNVQTAGAVGAGVGGFGAGAIAGAAAGTAIPIPVLGTLTGAIIGGLIGSYGGRALGIEAADALLDPEAAQALPATPIIMSPTYNTTTNTSTGEGGGDASSRGSSGSILDQWNTGVWTPNMIR